MPKAFALAPTFAPSFLHETRCNSVCDRHFLFERMGRKLPTIRDGLYVVKLLTLACITLGPYIS